MDDKKKLRVYPVIIAVISVVLVILIFVPVIKTMNSSYTVIIKDRSMNYFRAGGLFICGSTVICRREAASSGDIQSLPEENRPGSYLTVMSMDNILSIEVVNGEERDETDAADVRPEFLGSYKIELQGYDGILYLGVSKEKVYGTVRFPKWAKGARETLRGVRINSGGIKFTRSASTPAEMKRLGANYLFRQKFTGTYGSSGRIIKGYMINDRGERHEWKAKRK